MPTYTISLIPISALTFTDPANMPWSLQDGSGSGWNWVAAPFTFDSTAVLTVGVQDDDGILQDDPANPEWASGNQHSAHRQVLDEAITVNGVTWSADERRIENEYELNVMGSDGVTYRLVAISVANDPSSPWSGSTVIGFTFDSGLWPPEGVTLTSIPGTSADAQVLGNPAHPPCFTAGTLIATPAGPRPVESLKAGDLVLTLEGKALPLRWIGHMPVSAARIAADERLRPIRIGAGALGGGLPARDLVVSPQHRILLRTKVALRMFGAAEVLVPAKALIGLPGVSADAASGGVTYWHFALPGHRVVLAEGAPAESLYLGAEVLKMIPEAERDEMYRFYPQLAAAAVSAPEPARLLVRSRAAQRLVARLVQNARPALEPVADAEAPSRAA